MVLRWKWKRWKSFNYITSWFAFTGESYVFSLFFYSISNFIVAYWISSVNSMLRLNLSKLWSLSNSVERGITPSNSNYIINLLSTAVARHILLKLKWCDFGQHHPLPILKPLKLAISYCFLSQILNMHFIHFYQITVTQIICTQGSNTNGTEWSFLFP